MNVNFIHPFPDIHWKYPLRINKVYREFHVAANN